MDDLNFCPHCGHDLKQYRKSSMLREADLIKAAAEYVLSVGVAKTSDLQRKFDIGYARAANLIDKLEEDGIVGPPNGSKPREVLISKNHK